MRLGCDQNADIHIALGDRARYGGCADVLNLSIGQQTRYFADN